MLLAQLLEDNRDRLVISCLSARGCFQQFVGYASHRGDDHHQPALARSGSNDLDHFFNTRAISHRRAAKFHYANRLARV